VYIFKKIEYIKLIWKNMW